MKRGKLIIFEGISGTGKETQAKLLKEYLVKEHIKAQIVYHPSPELKTVLTDWRDTRNIDNINEVYLLLADRYSRVHQIITPALESGIWIIGLRNWISAVVYQGKTESERNWISQEFRKFEPSHDQLFYFDISPIVAYQRVLLRHRKTNEPLGKFETRELLTEKCQKYQQIIKKVPHFTINAELDISTIHGQIVKEIEKIV